MKLIQLVNSVEALNKLSETKLSAGASFALSKFLKEVTNDLETYNKVRKEKIEQYGKVLKDEEGNDKTDDKGDVIYSFSEPGSTVLTEDGKKFVEEMTEIENKEVTLTIPEIKVADLGTSQIEPKYLVALNWLIKE